MPAIAPIAVASHQRSVSLRFITHGALRQSSNTQVAFLVKAGAVGNSWKVLPSLLPILHRIGDLN